MKLDEHINKYYHNLNENDLYIWKYIKSNREACKSLTITEMSSRCHVSRTTLSRFVHKIDHRLYKTGQGSAFTGAHSFNTLHSIPPLLD